MTRYRVKNKVRFTIFLVVLILTVGSVFGALFGFDKAEGSSFTKYETITIVPGDTMWDIASEYVPANMDIRKYIYEICEVNDISQGDLKVGQEIKLPIK